MTVIIKFDRDIYTLKDARIVLHKNKIKYDEMKPTKKYYRFECDIPHAGGSIFGAIKKAYKGVIMALKGTRTNIKPASRKVLETDNNGDSQIVSIRVGRFPIREQYNFFVRVINGLTHSAPMHDKLFHLFLIIGLSNGNVLKIEKNYNINIVPYEKDKLEEDIDFSINDNMTIYDMFKNTLNNIGKDRLFNYDAFSNNCQRFTVDMLESNGIHVSDEQLEFILQDPDGLVPHWAEHIAHFVTNTLNRAETVIQGEGISNGN